LTPINSLKESEIEGERRKNCFGSLVMPIDLNGPCFPIDLYPHPNGSVMGVSKVSMAFQIGGDFEKAIL
jgi:hypothetical protein